jgi:SAM-dependent methyltransferase
MIELALNKDVPISGERGARAFVAGQRSLGDLGEAVGRPDASLAAPFMALSYVAHESWAWDNYKAVILGYAAQSRAHAEGRKVRVLEIGGGRDPLFSEIEAHRANLDFTVNDIDDSELALAPGWARRAHFDIAGDLAASHAKLGYYDLIVSQMVFEHVRNVPAAWANCHALLNKGGVAFAFFPTLFAPPYVLNYLMPEFLSAAVLRVFFPRRHQGVQPKFPAFYDHCRGSQDELAPLFKRIGFSSHLVAPFWSHGYFRKLPVLREIDGWLQNLARKRDWRALTTYAYAVARK